MTTSGPSTWILASASPRRLEILAGLGLKFAVDPCSLLEPAPLPEESPAAYAVRVARLKSRDVAGRHSSGVVIGADTIVVCGNEIFGKPSGREEARWMLLRLSGRWHRVVTGISLCDSKSGRLRSGHSESRVHFRRMSRAEVDWYLDTGEYADKAGAYAIQGHASLFIDRMQGCYFNIVGFPVATFERLCRKMGCRLMEHLAVRTPDSGHRKRNPGACGNVSPT